MTVYNYLNMSLPSGVEVEIIWHLSGMGRKRSTVTAGLGWGRGQWWWGRGGDGDSCSGDGENCGDVLGMGTK